MHGSLLLFSLLTVIIDYILLSHTPSYRLVFEIPTSTCLTEYSTPVRRYTLIPQTSLPSSDDTDREGDLTYKVLLSSHKTRLYMVVVDHITDLTTLFTYSTTRTLLLNSNCSVQHLLWHLLGLII